MLYPKKIMKKACLPTLLLLTLCFSGCAVVGGIFKAGAVVGVLAVIIVVALLIWIVSLFRGKD